MYNQEAVRECFEANPKEEVLFQTIDGQCFFNEDNARFHSKGVGGGLMVVEKAGLSKTDPATAAPKPKKK